MNVIESLPKTMDFVKNLEQYCLSHTSLLPKEKNVQAECCPNRKNSARPEDRALFFIDFLGKERACFSFDR